MPIGGITGGGRRVEITDAVAILVGIPDLGILAAGVGLPALVVGFGRTPGNKRERQEVHGASHACSEVFQEGHLSLSRIQRP